MPPRLVMDAPQIVRSKRDIAWPKKNRLLTNPPTQDIAVHVRDYARFTQMFKWGALICFIIGFIVLMIL